MGIVIYMLVIGWLWQHLRRLFGRCGPSWRHRGKRAASQSAAVVATMSPAGARNRPKPPWVCIELVHLKALCPHLGCRKLAEVFNRRFAATGTSVGKTYVADTLRHRQLEILRQRRTLKHRRPRPMPRNRVWAMDLTQVVLDGRRFLVLGLVDHGTRACLRLRVLTDKSSLTILRELLATFRRLGLPRCIRVDNEACFISRRMRLTLTLMGVRLQRSQPHCPWQNGRIERFFGTFKASLNMIGHDDMGKVPQVLNEYRTWYNHVRPHQHLGGKTPAEAWDRRARSTRQPIWFSAWNDALAGWYFPP